MALDIDTPDPTPPPAESEPSPPEPSIADHEAAFGTKPKAEPTHGEAEPDDHAPVAGPARDDKGQFVKERHRAKSQQAGPADVPRIAELTKRLRETEAERDALKVRVAPPAAIVSAPVVTPVPSLPPKATPQPAKPSVDNFDDYEAYVEALTDWKIGQAREHDRETARREADATALSTSWRSRVDDAKTRYTDFEQVALLAPTTIPEGSLVDAWILEHKSGADVLYSLQKDPGELQRILALPLFDQVEALTLLGQRMVPSREPAVKTGAAATVSPKVAPRPPTPVRTSAHPAPDEPPGDEASLAEHEKFFGPRARR